MKTLEELKSHIRSIITDELFFCDNPDLIGAHANFERRSLVDEHGTQYMPKEIIDALYGGVISLTMSMFKYVVDNSASYDFENLGVPIATEIKPDIIHKRVVVNKKGKQTQIYVCYIEIEKAYDAIYRHTREGVINEILKTI